MLKPYPKLFVMVCLVALPALAGCTSAATRDPALAPGGANVMAMSHAPRLNEPKDAPDPLNIVFHVEVYQLTVPFGTISRNEDFWKRINEHGVDVATYDLLYKNGIRAGEAPLSELQTFRRFLADVVPAQRLTITAMEARDVEIPVKKDLPEQTIFYYDDTNSLIGHSFDRCENVVAISFQPTPRRPGYLRLALCPVVRSHRKVLQYGLNNEARELAFVNPQRLYDLNLRIDIPRDSFLVVTASDDADRPTSVGRAFMLLDGQAERMEQVLLVIPRPYVASDSQSVVK